MARAGKERARGLQAPHEPYKLYEGHCIVRMETVTKYICSCGHSWKTFAMIGNSPDPVTAQPSGPADCPWCTSRLPVATVGAMTLPKKQKLGDHVLLGHPDCFDDSSDDEDEDDSAGGPSNDPTDDLSGRSIGSKRRASPDKLE